jgi:hypothetical protein
VDRDHFQQLNSCLGSGGDAQNNIMSDKQVKKSRASVAQHVVKEAVSNKLKAYYDDISRQEVPQRFLDLLQDLDKADERQK